MSDQLGLFDDPAPVKSSPAPVIQAGTCGDCGYFRKSIRYSGHFCELSYGDAEAANPACSRFEARHA